jgi:ABC-type branched-subunit amino acid transport system substrate-binding protein
MLSRIRLLSMAALGVFSLCSACSLIVTKKVDQCETTADCLAKGAGFENTVCSAKKACISADSANLPCASNQECIAKNNGQPAICRKSDQVCVPIKTDDCEAYGDFANDNAVFIGALFSRTGSGFSNGTARESSARLAMEEIQSATGGLPGLNGGPKRPLALISCDDRSTVPDSERAATFLVKQAQVQAIIGPGTSSYVLNLAEKVITPQAGVFLISSAATSAALTTLDDGNLIWRTCPSDELQGLALSKIVPVVEERIRTDQGLQSTDAIKLALVSRGDSYGINLAKSLFSTVQFNGKSAADNGTDYLPIEYKDPGLPENASQDYSPFVDKILAEKPAIVVLIGQAETIVNFVDPIESQWEAKNGAAPRPTYVFAEAGKRSELLNSVVGTPELRKRVIGTAPGKKSPLFEQFVFRMSKSYPTVDTSIFGLPGTYDSVYLIAYSIASLGATPITGTGIAAGMSKLVTGSQVKAESGPVESTFGLLSSGGTINFEGVSGPLDFDLKTGEAISDIDIWCVNDSVQNPQFQSSGQYYDATSGMLSGTFGCQ